MTGRCFGGYNISVRKVFCDSSTRKGCIVFEDGGYAMPVYCAPVTNNTGEYLVVIRALEKIIARGGEEQTIICTDSLLVVNQVKGTWQCRKPRLVLLRDRVRQLSSEAKATLLWIPREENLAGIILDRKRGS